MFRLIKQVFVVLFSFSKSISSMADASKPYKMYTLIPLNNKPCMTQPTLINLHPNKYIQGLHYYLFAVNLGKCRGSYKVVMLLMIYPIDCMFQKNKKKIENLNLSVLNK